MLVVVLIGAGFILFFPARQVLQQRGRIGSLESRLSELRTENTRLNEEVGRLTDKSQLEVLARERLGLVRPGEKAYFVEPVKPKTTPAPETSRGPSWWDRAWESFTSLLRGRE
jgi:cell division protein FtsB